MSSHLRSPNAIRGAAVAGVAAVVLIALLVIVLSGGSDEAGQASELPELEGAPSTTVGAGDAPSSTVPRPDPSRVSDPVTERLDSSDSAAPDMRGGPRQRSQPPEVEDAVAEPQVPPGGAPGADLDSGPTTSTTRPPSSGASGGGAGGGGSGGTGGGGTAPSPGSPVATRFVSPWDLQVEDCLVLEADFEIREVGVTTCSSPHHAEVFALYTVPESTFASYPGWSTLRQVAYADCQLFFEDYVGIPFWDSIYDIAAITPGPSAWADGDREVVCLVVEIERRPLTGMVKDSAV